MHVVQLYRVTRRCSVEHERTIILVAILVTNVDTCIHRVNNHALVIVARHRLIDGIRRCLAHGSEGIGNYRTCSSLSIGDTRLHDRVSGGVISEVCILRDSLIIQAVHIVEVLRRVHLVGGHDRTPVLILRTVESVVGIAAM